jgi:hypothetical protein
MIAIDARETAFASASKDNYIRNPDLIYKGFWIPNKKK